MAAGGIRRPVRQLSVDVARKIAAGEVIDRPAAIVRELLDNAVDSGADSISVEIAGGGIDKIRVADNGGGMTREDLSACARPHCTSKIETAADLMRISTLGFRGEALASIAAVAHLSIASGTARMTAHVSGAHEIQTIPPFQNGVGTVVQSERLFEDFPARRRFLKRPASETALCRDVFVEKAIPRPDIAFRLTVDGTLRFDLPAGVSLAERFARALELRQKSALFSELSASGTEADGTTKWSFRLVIGEPAVFRTDRKHIFIYVNGRRVSEFALVQAIEYGGQGFFPNGTHPVASLFLTVDPTMVDFNIHPAKREVRFKDMSSVHHGVSSTVRTFFRAYGIKSAADDTTPVYAQPMDFGDEPPARMRADSADASGAAPPRAQADSTTGFSGNTDSARTTARTDFSAGFAGAHGGAGRRVEYDVSHGGTRPGAYADSRNAARGAAGRGQFGAGGAETSEAQTLYERDFAGAVAAQFSAAADSAGAPPADIRARILGYERNPYKTQSLAADALGTTLAAALPAAAPANSASPADSADSGGFRYLGTALGTFLLAEVRGTLYLIDQHAAHERILFNKLMAGGGESQPLLVPYVIRTDRADDDAYLGRVQAALAGAGFTARNAGGGTWEITTVPARWTGTEDDLRAALLDERTDPGELMYAIAAMTACKAAVKDGTVLDAETAAQLARDALALSDPHCPHGRPVWTSFTREQLFARVRRTERRGTV